MIDVDYSAKIVYAECRTLSELYVALAKQRTTDEGLRKYERLIVLDNVVVARFMGFTLLRRVYTLQEGWRIK